MHSTSRLGIQVIDASDPVSNYPGVDSQAKGVLDNSVTYSQGTISSIPAAGLAGRVYYATDTKRWYLDNGTVWVPLLPGLATRVITSGATAVSGDLIVVTSGNPLTVTLPAPALGAQVGVLAIAASGASPVTVSGTNIYGVGLSAASSFPLGTAGAQVSLQSDGANWYIVSGQQDTGWVAITPGTGIADLSGGTGYTIASRVRGDHGELRGQLDNNSGGVIGSSAIIATIAASCRPAKFVWIPWYAVNVNGGMTHPVAFGANGQLTLQASLPISEAYSLNGFTYPIVA